MSSDDPAVAAILRATVEQLESVGVADEALGELRTHRRLGPVRLPPRFVATGRAWRLGEVLLTREGLLFTTGSVSRAVEPRQFAANKSPAEAERRDIQRLAARGPFAPGETVNFGQEPIALDQDTLDAGSGRIIRRDGILAIRLAQAEVPLETYLTDRVRSMSAPDWD